MFVLGCHIIIGHYSFTRCNAVEIEKSYDLVANTAKITIPTTAVLESKGMTTAVETAQLIREGMPVSIELRYENVFSEIEFTGYVKRVNYKMPIEIECENEVYLLRKKNINKSWTSTTLKAVLEYVLQGTAIELAEEPPEVTLAPYSIKNANGAFALQKIKDDFGLTIYINQEGKLYVGLAYKENTGTVKYSLTGDETNVINADDLKYHSKDDVVLKVKAILIHGDNTRTTVELGDSDGELKTLHFYNVSNEAELRKLAQQEMDKLKYDGYEGKLITFLIPKAIPGMKAELTDPRFPGREGSYYVEAVKTTFGTGGARREVEIGIKLS